MISLNGTSLCMVCADRFLPWFLDGEEVKTKSACQYKYSIFERIWYLIIVLQVDSGCTHIEIS